MAKRTGIGCALYVHGYDLSDDTGGVPQLACPRGTQDVTGLRSTAFERRELTRDGVLGFTGFWNVDPGGLHELASTLPRTDLIATLCIGETIGSAAASLVALEYDYNATRGADGSLNVGFSSSANGYGLDWGELLTAGLRADTAATNGSALDGGAATAFGLQAFLHVFSFTGTSVTVKLQDSADNSSWADITGAGFTAATAVGAERIQTARNGAVRRYVRAVTTGTFTEATFAVGFTRNLTETAF